MFFVRSQKRASGRHALCQHCHRAFHDQTRARQLRAEFVYGRFAVRAAIVALFAAMLGCAPACGIELPASTPPSANVAVTVADLSGSTDIADRCAEVAAVVRDELQRAGDERVDLLVLGTGSDRAGGEPVALVPWTSRVRERRSFERPNAGAVADAEFVEKVGETCNGTMPSPSATSPIVRAIERAVGSIRAREQVLRADGYIVRRRSLVIMSDLHADDATVQCRLAGKSRKRICPPLPKLDPTGVDVFVCGVGNHRGRETVDATAQRDVWREILGKPDLELDATCPRETVGRATQ